LQDVLAVVRDTAAARRLVLVRLLDPLLARPVRVVMRLRLLAQSLAPARIQISLEQILLLQIRALSKPIPIRVPFFQLKKLQRKELRVRSVKDKSVKDKLVSWFLGRWELPLRALLLKRKRVILVQMAG
jgi:hypothetical protein